MILDILCPGSWMDSYESRMLGEGSWHMPVNSFNDLMNVCKTYFATESGKQSQELFCDFNLYLDYELIGTYRKGEITLFPIIDWDKKDFQRGRFRHGRNGYIVNIDAALKYGLNKRSVRVDDTHVW